MNDRLGFTLVDKAGGWTSHDVVARARRIFGIRRIGHAGTLDPMATGLLVLGIGRATRLLRFITAQAKEYEATARFGVATDTLDADGEVLERCPMDIDRGGVEAAMAGFVGDLMQAPPMVSAVKVGGKRLHELARRGQVVERPPRPVRVDRLTLERFDPGAYPIVRFRAVGGGGLYIRVLADDIARALGGRAHLTALRRVGNGSLRVESARSVEELARLGARGRLDAAILPPGEGLAHLPSVEAVGSEIEMVRNGRRLPTAHPAAERGGYARIMSGDRLLAVYRIDGRELAPEVVLA